MVTLHIEHSVNDYDLWRTAFGRFAQVRAQSGVLAERIQRPVDDPRYVVIDLDFADAGHAQGFLAFLQTKVWASPDTSPALVGVPATKVLEQVAAA
jgi:hypothetical protein